MVGGCRHTGKLALFVTATTATMLPEVKEVFAIDARQTASEAAVPFAHGLAVDAFSFDPLLFYSLAHPLRRTVEQELRFYGRGCYMGSN